MCGAPLAAAASAQREERKVVTVLFCDLVGFTQRAEQLDPEDVRAVLAPYHARLRSELERHGGTVEKFIGDAVMALFGAPVAHEDDPERAVRAALAIRDFALEEGLELRIGVTTGEALITLSASPAEGEGMASGDVVNTAARLQSAAPVNGILVDETTYRATRRAIEYGDAPSVDAKGKAEPISVWEATGARSRFGVDVAHHARAELVGRERELDVLRDAFERTRHERNPQLVTLVAVPGMGKSRLIYELSRIVDADPELVTWRQGRCLSYGDGVAFWALAELVKAQAGISERDTEAEAAEKLHSTVEDVFVDDSDARWVESHLRPLVGLEAETGLGGDRRGEAFAAWRRFLEALAEERPLVLVLEDLHWADEGLLDFVDELIDWLSGVPLLVVCSARPELLERRPGWGGGKLNTSTIGLSPLSQEQTAVLISHVLERSLLPAEIQQALLERSEGNPLYAEQFAQLYLERGSADDLPLPETLQGIVAARLDGLSTDEKAVLQDAAVVGKVFWTGALRRDEQGVVPLLHSLERKGFLTRQRRSSVESEGEWAFSHMLLRDVAYRQIPRGDRAAKHRQTAEWIEGLGRPDDHAELLAFHWSSALELTHAAGQDTADLTTPTRLALRAAGDHAFAVNAYPAAAAYYQDALASWPEDDEERPQLLYRHADALYVAADEHALDALEEARDALLAADDRETAAEAEISVSRVWWHRGRSDEASAHQARAAELAGSAVSPATARVIANVARTSSIGGDAEEGLRLATDALAMAETLGLDELRAHALATIGVSKGYLGDPSGVKELELALELALAAHSPQASVIANNLGVAAFEVGDMRREGELFVEAKLIAERFGDGSGARWMRGQLSAMAYLYGNWDEAYGAFDEFITECETSPHYLEYHARHLRGHIRVARGDSAGGLADIEYGLVLARETKDPQSLFPAIGASMIASEFLGLTSEATRLSHELMELLKPYQGDTALASSFWLVWSQSSRGLDEALRKLVERAPEGRWKEIALASLDHDFSRAADLWLLSGSPTWEAFLRMRAAEELIATGRRAEGEAELARASAFYRTVGATFLIQRGEQLLAKSA
jgi:class 3 adenylate cyclase/tetratricopeptide (TPR) repeat protein